MNLDTTTNSDNCTEQKRVKADYQKPELVLYGDIGAMTQATDMNGAADNGMGKTSKT